VFELDALLVQTFHCVHFACVRLAAAVDFAKPAAADYAMNAEVVHAQLNIELVVFPLAKSCEFLAVDEFSE
jgi:hypothetical protein